MKYPSDNTCKKLEEAQIAGLFILPNLMGFKGKHILVFHALAFLLSMFSRRHSEISRLNSLTRGLTGLGFLSTAFSKLTMQKRARLFYGFNGLLLTGLAALAAYNAMKKEDTWTDAASKAQDALDSGRSVSDKNKKEMGDHAAA